MGRLLLRHLGSAATESPRPARGSIDDDSADAHRLDYTPMTPTEMRIAKELIRCSFLPASWDKHFCRDMAAIATNAPEHELSEYQNANLLRLVHKHRRQLPTAVIELALDEMERNTDRRAAEGRGALPLFTKPGAPKMTIAEPPTAASVPLL